MTTDKVTIDRELLEQVASEFEHDNDRYMLGRELRKVLDAPRQPEGEGLKVVAWISCDGLNDLKRGGSIARYVVPSYSGGAEIALCRLSDAQRAIAELREEISDLHTTMMAAAVEIQEHWQAHCDEEGYGPANLIHRLERGIAAQYGYTAQTLVQIEAERDTLRQQLADVAEGNTKLHVLWTDAVRQRDKLAGLLREAHSAGRSRRLTVDELYRINAALAEVKP